MARRTSIPIACTLAPDGAAAQAAEWVALRDHLIDRTVIEGGQRLWFPAALAGQVRDLARREASCCAFLTLDVTETGDTVEVAITSDSPAAAPVIAYLAGG